MTQNIPSPVADAVVILARAHLTSLQSLPELPDPPGKIQRLLGLFHTKLKSTIRQLCCGRNLKHGLPALRLICNVIYICRTCSPVSPDVVVYEGSDELLNDDISLEYDMEETLIYAGAGNIFPGFSRIKSVIGLLFLHFSVFRIMAFRQDFKSYGKKPFVLKHAI